MRRKVVNNCFRPLCRLWVLTIVLVGVIWILFFRKGEHNHQSINSIALDKVKLAKTVVVEDQPPPSGDKGDALSSRLSILKDSLNSLLAENGTDDPDPMLLKGLLNSENVIIKEAPSTSSASNKEVYTPRGSSISSSSENDKLTESVPENSEISKSSSPPHHHSDHPDHHPAPHHDSEEHHKHVWKRKKKGFFDMLFSGSGPDDVVNGFLNAITGTKDENEEAQ